ncbi:MAG: hypothetical protein LBS21_07530 [Clostridiales bacterium]|nr:hypothetical protein [Clostridiales bacterium]
MDEAKNASDYICDTCDNDGVAKWLGTIFYNYLLFCQARRIGQFRP